MNNSIRNIVCCLTAVIFLITSSGCEKVQQWHLKGLEAEKERYRTSPHRYDNCLSQVKSPNSAEREAAWQTLATAGKYAIPQLVRIARGHHRVRVKRSVYILRGHLKSADKELQAAARAALENVSRTGAVVGQRLAREALAFGKQWPEIEAKQKADAIVAKADAIAAIERRQRKAAEERKKAAKVREEAQRKAAEDRDD